MVRELNPNLELSAKKNVNVRKIFIAKRKYKNRTRIQRLVTVPKELPYKDGDFVILLPYIKKYKQFVKRIKEEPEEAEA